MVEQVGFWWFGAAGFILLFFIIVGVFVTGSPVGILIDSRNKMSLSRLQISVWTWMLTSSFFAIGICYRTMNIELDEQLWALLGISLGSTAGAVIIKGTKKSAEPTGGALAIFQRRNINVMQGHDRHGVIHLKAKPSQARFLDMFKAEEIVDYDHIDISKVQMFFFTLAVWLGYLYQLWSWELPDISGVQADAAIVFPPLSSSLVTVIGISHVGYLTIKAAPKAKTE